MREWRHLMYKSCCPRPRTLLSFDVLRLVKSLCLSASLAVHHSKLHPKDCLKPCLPRISSPRFLRSLDSQYLPRTLTLSILVFSKSPNRLCMYDTLIHRLYRHHSWMMCRVPVSHVFEALLAPALLGYLLFAKKKRLGEG